MGASSQIAASAAAAASAPVQLYSPITDSGTPTNRSSGVGTTAAGNIYAGSDGDRPPNPLATAVGGYLRYNWLISGPPSSFEIRLTITGGTLGAFDTANGSLISGTWYGMNATRNWYMYQSGAGSATTTGTIEIRRVSDGVVIASTTFTMTGRS